MKAPAAITALVLSATSLASADQTDTNISQPQSASVDRPFAAEVVTEQEVMKMLYDLAPNGPHVPDYGEIANAIASAATQDPLFPWMKSGSKRTACLLVAMAFKESSFHRSVVGDQGRSFGLYQIQPPTARVSVKLLTVPRDASFVAVDLFRQSFKKAAEKGRPFHEGLAWYIASSDVGMRHPKVVVLSMERVALAERLFRKHFVEYASETNPSPALMLAPKKPKEPT
jgi:hypothetical protein